MERILFRNSLGARLLRYVFGFYFIVTVVVTVIQLSAEYYHTKDSMIAEIVALEQTFKSSFAKSLWEYNTSQLESTLLGLHQMEIVAGIKVTNNDHVMQAAIGEFIDEDVYSLAPPEKNRIRQISKGDTGIFNTLFEYQFLIEYQDTEEDPLEVLGVGYIYAHEDTIINRVKYGFMLIVINSVIKTLALWFIFLFIINRVVEKPLSLFIKATEELDFNNPVEPSSLSIAHETFHHRQDELWVLGRSFLTMRQLIFEKIESLNQLHRTLEQKVEESTQGLKKSLISQKTLNEELTATTVELKRAQKQLLLSQKMEALGTLAGGIAHEFNNILMMIIGNTKLLLMRVHEEDKNKTYLKTILKSGNRATDLVRQILTFSRMEVVNIQPTNLTPVIQETLKMAQATLPANVEIRQNLQENDASVMADSSQIHQIILNLCTNSYHAMEESGGLLEISLKQLERYPSSVSMEKTSVLQLSVKDNGCGIPLESQEQIFDPFFTTKEVGKGTGLGLAVVHGIVESHGGKLLVESIVGEGTQISIFFPIIKKEEIYSRNDFPREK